MSQNNLFKGVLFVAIGASSYGMLATFVRLAYQEDFTTSEVVTSQFVYGILGMLLIMLFQKNTKEKITKPNISKLLMTGTSLGLTSVFYYECIKYIDVSIAIVLLMQTVWIGVVLEAIIDKKLPSKQKSIAVLIVLVGTILATNLVQNQIKIDYRGIIFGLLAATSFTITMFASNKIATEISTITKSFYMLLGGGVIIFCYAMYNQHMPFNFDIFLRWGILVSLFGTIIPPLLFNIGFPKTGIGLGSIIASFELPVSVSMAYFILNEKVNALQWLGIILIISAIVLMNINLNKNK